MDYKAKSIESQPSLTQTRPPRRLGRFSLRTLLLLTTTVASWIAYATGIGSISRDLKEIEVLHPLAPELFIRNVDEYSCLAIDRTDNIEEYRCYLPSGRIYQLNLNWQNHVNADKYETPDLSHRLEPGRYRIYFERQIDRIVVRVDDQVVFDVAVPNSTHKTFFTTGANDRFQSQWYPLDRPLLLRSRIPAITNPSQPETGESLWIN